MTTMTSGKEETNGLPVALPPVVLDTTLAELYSQSSMDLANKQVGQVLSGLSAAMALTPDIPRNRKFIYQDSPFTNGDVSPEDKISTTVKYLSLVTQRDAFISGASPTIFFHLSDTRDKRLYDQGEVEKTLSVLSHSQRPKMIFCNGPGDMPIGENGIDLIACKVVLDDLERYDNIIPPETHWFLNSKAALGASGLPTPKCDVVNIDGFPVDASTCCTICQGLDADDYIIPADCIGERGTWFKAQSARLLETIAKRPLPFVLKNQETFGGAGTYIAQTEEDRERILDSMRKGGIMSRLLSAVNELNTHLGPATLLFSDLVVDPVRDYGLTFFVNDTGQDSVFLGISEQMLDGGTAWIGSTIDYDAQDELRRKFEPLMKQVAGWLQSHGYIGPAGADLLETADGEFHVVDLNVRTTGSLCLPLLRSHFVDRGLRMAASFSIDSDMRRSAFVDRFRDECLRGQVCILSWYEDKDKGHSLGDVAIGAKDEKELQELTQRIKELSHSITF